MQRLAQSPRVQQVPETSCGRQDSAAAVVPKPLLHCAVHTLQHFQGLQVARQPCLQLLHPQFNCVSVRSHLCCAQCNDLQSGSAHQAWRLLPVRMAWHVIPEPFENPCRNGHAVRSCDVDVKWLLALESRPGIVLAKPLQADNWSVKASIIKVNCALCNMSGHHPMQCAGRCPSAKSSLKHCDIVTGDGSKPAAPVLWTTGTRRCCWSWYVGRHGGRRSVAPPLQL